MRLLVVLILCLGVGPVLAQSQVELGADAFRRCLACHAVGEDAGDKVGPQLNGVVGRPIGGLDDYTYSQTLQRANAAGQIWTREALTRLLKNPRHAFAGTSMNFAGMRQRSDIDAIIAYLASFGEDGTQTAP